MRRRSRTISNGIYGLDRNGPRVRIQGIFRAKRDSRPKSSNGSRPAEGHIRIYGVKLIVTSQ